MIVVDSNIAFSAIFNIQSKIGQLIITGSKYFDFYTVGLLKNEIIEHKEKTLHTTKFMRSRFKDTFQLIVSGIKFVNDLLLADKDLNRAICLVTGNSTLKFVIKI